MRSPLRPLIFLGVAAVLATYAIVDTRFGVYLVLDVFGAIGDEAPDYNADNGPLALSGQLTPVMEVALPADIEQPSGIQHIVAAWLGYEPCVRMSYRLTTRCVVLTVRP